MDFCCLESPSLCTINYFSLKDRSHAVLRSSLVYKFQCPDDPGQSYVGKTKRNLKQRVIEHKKSGSAIHTHLIDCNTCRNSDSFFDSFSVLGQANNDFELRILEALQIMDKRPNINKQLTGNGTSFILNVF